MIGCRILGTGAALPDEAVETAALLAEAAPGRDPAVMLARIGITSRRRAAPAPDAAAALGAEALERALAAAGLEGAGLRRLIFVSSTGGDSLIPATANAVAARLGLPPTVGAFDLNNACTGFLTAFDLAARLVATGEGPVAIVVSEVFSRHIGPASPRSYLVMGDAAAAVILGEGRPGEGVLAVDFGNDGGRYAAATLGQQGISGARELLEFGVPAGTIAEYAIGDVQRSVAAVFGASGFTASDVDFFLPHQPNGPLLLAFCEAVGLSPERATAVVDGVGSTGAASVPLALDQLWRSGAVGPGARLLFVAVGAGTSRGAVLYRTAPGAAGEGSP